MAQWSFSQLSEEIDAVRERIHELRRSLQHYYVGKDELIDLMVLSAAAQEPFLIVGPPGTAKSDLIVRFCQGIGVEDEYFEYMLTKFTEPSEILGPIDISELREGRFLRKFQGRLPEAKVAFLDEIFKSNSAILNVLLTLVNERKVYQDGKPQKVPLVMLFAATNEVPEFRELDALKDRFILKARSASVQDQQFDALIDRGVANDMLKIFGQKPWSKKSSLEDFQKVRRYLDLQMAGLDKPGKRPEEGLVRDRETFFPAPVRDLFRRILRTLTKEDKVFVSDRKLVKLYRLLRMRAFLFHGGAVREEDLVLLRHCGDREQHFETLPEKVDRMLGLEG